MQKIPISISSISSKGINVAGVEKNLILGLWSIAAFWSRQQRQWAVDQWSNSVWHVHMALGKLLSSASKHRNYVSYFIGQLLSQMEPFVRYEHREILRTGQLLSTQSYLFICIDLLYFFITFQFSIIEFWKLVYSRVASTTSSKVLQNKYIHTD